MLSLPIRPHPTDGRAWTNCTGNVLNCLLESTVFTNGESTGPLTSDQEVSLLDEILEVLETCVVVVPVPERLQLAQSGDVIERAGLPIEQTFQPADLLGINHVFSVRQHPFRLVLTYKSLPALVSLAEITKKRHALLSSSTYLSGVLGIGVVHQRTPSQRIILH